MARLIAEAGFNMSDIDLYDIFDEAYDFGFEDDVTHTHKGITYQDVFWIEYEAYSEIALAGPNITVDSYGYVTGGTVTGIADVSFDKNYDVSGYSFTIDGFSIAATEVADAVLSPSTTDDYQILREIFSGKDSLTGSSDADVLYGYNGNDVIKGKNGNDKLGGGNNNDKLYGGNNNDKLYGGSGKDKLYGGSGKDKLYGGSNNDKLYGGSGNDLLKGGAGGDTLRGDKGKDVMFGGSGADKFVFRKISDSSVKASSSDIIKDFKKGTDKIDLHFIDASTELSGNNAFTFDGTKSFGTSKQGDIYYKKFNNAGTSNDFTMVYIDTDADSGKEMSIKLMGLHNLTADDFIL